MIVHDHMLDAGCLDLSPERAIERMFKAAVGAPCVLPRDGLVRRNGIGYLRQDLREVAANGYHEPFAHGVVRAVGLWTIDHRERAIGRTWHAGVRAVPVEHRAAVPAAFKKIDLEPTFLVAIRKIRHGEALYDLRLASRSRRNLGHRSGGRIEVDDERLALPPNTRLEVGGLILLHRTAVELRHKVALLRRGGLRDYRLLACRERKRPFAGIDSLHGTLKRFQVAARARLHVKGRLEIVGEYGHIVKMHLEILRLRAAGKLKPDE